MTQATTASAKQLNLETERGLLGALLIDSDRMIDVAPIIRHDDFYDPVNRTIYAVMLRLYEERSPIDPLTLSDALKGEQKVNAAGGVAYLATLTTDVPMHAKRYAEIVRENSVKRQIVKAGGAIAQLASDANASADELVEAAESHVLHLSRQSTLGKPVDLHDLTAERYEHYAMLHETKSNADHVGIQTGFEELDRKLVGLAPGHLMILAGRQGMGKTAFALELMRRVTNDQQKKVTLCSLEMTKEEVADRLFANMLGVETWMLKRGSLRDEQFQRMGDVFDDVSRGRIFIDDDADNRLTNLRSKARRQQMEEGIDLLIVDYLQLIEVTDKAANDNQVQRISYISRNLKKLARELHCPIIALSQLNRKCEERPKAIPFLSDLRDSGSIEQDADSVLMMYREGYYNEDCEHPDRTDLYVRKNRHHGLTGVVSLRFSTANQSYESFAM